MIELEPNPECLTSEVKFWMLDLEPEPMLKFQVSEVEFYVLNLEPKLEVKFRNQIFMKQCQKKQQN